MRGLWLHSIRSSGDWRRLLCSIIFFARKAKRIRHDRNYNRWYPQLRLDPLFISHSTWASRAPPPQQRSASVSSFTILLAAFLRGKTITTFFIRTKFQKAHARICYTQRIPSLCRQGLASISTIALNVSAAHFVWGRRSGSDDHRQQDFYVHFRDIVESDEAINPYWVIITAPNTNSGE